MPYRASKCHTYFDKWSAFATIYPISVAHLANRHIAACKKNCSQSLASNIAVKMNHIILPALDTQVHLVRGLPVFVGAACSFSLVFEPPGAGRGSSTVRKWPLQCMCKCMKAINKAAIALHTNGELTSAWFLSIKAP